MNEEPLGTLEIRINNNQDKKYLFAYIRCYRHWQNIYTLLVTELFTKQDADYRYFLDYEIVRACISDTPGKKNKLEKTRYIKEKYEGHGLYQSLLEVGRKLKGHNLVRVMRRFKKDFNNYIESNKAYQSNPNTFKGKPHLPRAKKLSKLTIYAIPLDNDNGWRIQGEKTTKKKVVGINLYNKSRDFYLGDILQDNKILGKAIQNQTTFIKGGTNVVLGCL